LGKPWLFHSFSYLYHFTRHPEVAFMWAAPSHCPVKFEAFRNPQLPVGSPKSSGCKAPVVDDLFGDDTNQYIDVRRDFSMETSQIRRVYINQLLK